MDPATAAALTTVAGHSATVPSMDDIQTVYGPSASTVGVLLLILLLTSAVYVAKDYTPPKARSAKPHHSRRDRLKGFVQRHTSGHKKKRRTSVPGDDNGDDAATAAAAGSSEQEAATTKEKEVTLISGPWALVVRIGVWPLAALYLFFRLLWGLYRLAVYAIMDAAVYTNDFLLRTLRQAPNALADVLMRSGPFVLDYMVRPAVTAAKRAKTWCDEVLVTSVIPLCVKLRPVLGGVWDLSKTFWFTVKERLHLDFAMLERLRTLAQRLGESLLHGMKGPFVWCGTKGVVLSLLAWRCCIVLSGGLYRDARGVAGIVLQIGRFAHVHLMRPLVDASIDAGRSAWNVSRTVVAPGIGHVAAFIATWTVRVLLTAFLAGYVGAHMVAITVNGMVQSAYHTAATILRWVWTMAVQVLMSLVVPACSGAARITQVVLHLVGTTVLSVTRECRKLSRHAWNSFVLPIVKIIPMLHKGAVRLSAMIYQLVATIGRCCVSAFHATVLPLVDAFVAGAIEPLAGIVNRFALRILDASSRAFTTGMGHVASAAARLCASLWGWTAQLQAFVLRILAPLTADAITRIRQILSNLSKPLHDALALAVASTIRALGVLGVAVATQTASTVKWVDRWFTDDAVPYADSMMKDVSKFAEMALDRCVVYMTEYSKFGERH